MADKHRVLCAAPDALAQRGMPRTLNDLGARDLAWRSSAAGAFGEAALGVAFLVQWFQPRAHPDGVGQT